MKSVTEVLSIAFLCTVVLTTASEITDETLIYVKLLQVEKYKIYKFKGFIKCVIVQYTETV